MTIQKIIFNALLMIWIISIPLKNSLYQISVVLLGVYFVVFVLYSRDFKNLQELAVKYRDLITSFLIIFCVMLISNIINPTDRESWELTFFYMQRYGLIIFVLLYFYSKAFFSLKLLVYFILASLLLQSIDGIFQSVYGFDFIKHYLGSVQAGLTGGTYNRNVFGFFMGIGLLVVFLYQKEKYRFISYSSLGIFTFCVLFAHTRAVWVALFCSLFVYLIIDRQALRKNWITIAVLLLIASALFFSVDSLQARLDALLEGNSSHRTDIWLHGLNLIKEKWILGYGVDMFDEHGYMGIKSMHNQTLEILFDLGFTGLLAFFGLLVLIIKELKQFHQKKLFVFLVFFIVNGMFGESIISSKTMLSTLSIFVFFVFAERINFKKGLV